MFTLAFIIYMVGVIIFLSFGGVIVYHLRRYGFIGDATKPMAAIFFLVTAVIIIASAVNLFQTDWDNPDLIDTSSSSIEETPDTNAPGTRLRDNE